tara:strand:- start:492 stop:656 length:165 start_codon:yes stop_codon:yes gene_type:complete
MVRVRRRRRRRRRRRKIRKIRRRRRTERLFRILCRWYGYKNEHYVNFATKGIRG